MDTPAPSIKTLLRDRSAKPIMITWAVVILIAGSAGLFAPAGDYKGYLGMILGFVVLLAVPFWMGRRPTA